MVCSERFQSVSDLQHFRNPGHSLASSKMASGGRGDRLLVLLAVLARVRGAGFDLAVHAGEW